MMIAAAVVAEARVVPPAWLWNEDLDQEAAVAPQALHGPMVGRSAPSVRGADAVELSTDLHFPPPPHSARRPWRSSSSAHASLAAPGVGAQGGLLGWGG